jgi:hypothetical protein
MLKHILFFLLLPLLAHAQLKEFEVSEMPRPDVSVVQGNKDFPEDALLLVSSSIRDLNFRSSLGAIDKVTFNPSANRYEILVRPLKQMVFVYHRDFMEMKISTINPNPKDVLYYKVDEHFDNRTHLAPGSLQIHSAPASAELMINGNKLQAITPYFGEKWNPGKLKVRVEKVRFHDLDTLVTVRSGETTTLSVSLRPKLGGLTVSSTPSGADVFVNQQLQGKTPYYDSLQIGEYLVRVSLYGFAEQVSQVRVNTGYPVRLSYDLKPERIIADKPVNDKMKIARKKPDRSYTPTGMRRLLIGTGLAVIGGAMQALGVTYIIQQANSTPDNFSETRLYSGLVIATVSIPMICIGIPVSVSSKKHRINNRL